MEPPLANNILDTIEKKLEFKCKNENNEITINISTTKNLIIFSTNPYLILCKSLDDIIEEIKLLIEEKKSSFIEETNKINLIIPTHMNKAPQIIISINEIEKDINLKIQEIYDFILKFYDENKKTNEQNIKKLLDENEKMKNMIKKLEEKVDLLSNENNELKCQIGIISPDDLDKIKKWIDPQNYQKIKFECIYKFLDRETNRDTFNKKCNVNVPVVIIIITKKKIFLEHMLQILQLHLEEIIG